jgi:hypothetical protein
MGIKVSLQTSLLGGTHNAFFTDNIVRLIKQIRIAHVRDRWTVGEK